MGSTKLESELLPQCWEQLGHKYSERRLLVAESVAVLAPYTPSALRNSLLLSMLQQMLGPGGEREISVRDAAMISLALLITYLDDSSKTSALISTLIHCLEIHGWSADLSPFAVPKDSVSTVPYPSIYYFYSSLALWSLELKLLPEFLEPQLTKLNQISMELNLEKQSAQKNQHSPTKNFHTNQVIFSLLSALKAVCPFILALLIDSAPITDEVPITTNTFLSSPDIANVIDELGLILGTKEKAKIGLCKIRQYMSKEWYKSWSELDYFTKTFLPSLVEPLCYIDPSSESLIQAYITLFLNLSLSLGHNVTSSHITPLFLSKLNADDGGIDQIREGKSGLTSAILVVYTVAILASREESIGNGELQDFLARQTSILSLCGAPLDTLESCIINLLSRPNTEESVLGALWSCVVHKSTSVRMVSASLWGLLIGQVEEGSLSNRVVPALVTLATDPDEQVRAASLSPLSSIIITSSNKEVCIVQLYFYQITK